MPDVCPRCRSKLVVSRSRGKWRRTSRRSAINDDGFVPVPPSPTCPNCSRAYVRPESSASANSAISAIISKAIGVAIRYTGEARLYSIDRDRWIDLVTPSLNATLHALGLGKSQLPQRFCQIQTATAGMTVNYNGLAAEFLNVWQPGIHLLDRQQSSSRNSTELVLV